MGSAQSRSTLHDALMKHSRTGDLNAVISCLSRAANQADEAGVKELINARTSDTQKTALIVASEEGNVRVVTLLLERGADVHHVAPGPKSGSAIHVAASCRYLSTSQSLLGHGANPFVENASGYTALDYAVENKHVALLRTMERYTPYAGWVMVRVSRLAGLTSEWKLRWCTAFDRYPYPGLPPNKQLITTVLLLYEDQGTTDQKTKVWLNGATAVCPVISPSDSHCELVLHPDHRRPSGCHTKGDSRVGYSMYLKGCDSSPTSMEYIRLLVKQVNRGAAEVPPPQPPAPPPAQYAAPGQYPAVDASLPHAPSVYASAHSSASHPGTGAMGLGLVEASSVEGGGSFPRRSGSGGGLMLGSGSGHLGSGHLGSGHLGSGHLGSGHLGSGHLGSGHLTGAPPEPHASGGLEPLIEGRPGESDEDLARRLQALFMGEESMLVAPPAAGMEPGLYGPAKVFEQPAMPSPSAPPAPIYPPAPAVARASAPPDQFVCPITQELMRDPVIAADGHTYDHAAILKWLTEHNTSPMTNETLEDMKLMQNHNVRSAIRSWIDEHPEASCEWAQ